MVVVVVAGGGGGLGGWGLSLRPFQEYFTCVEPIIHQRWAKTGEPWGKTT